MRTDLASKLAEWRCHHMPPERIETRKQAERRARDVLSRRVGQLDARELWEVFQALDEDGAPSAGKRRFGVMLARPNYNRMAAALGVLNEWMARLWTVDESAAAALVDEFGEASPVKGATGRFASLILYLRNPELFVPWVRPLADAVSIEREGVAADFPNYVAFNAAASEMRARHQLLPQELDALSPRSWDDGIVPGAGAYWWVNQGSTYKDAARQRSIWAPRESKKGTHLFHWDNVSKVRTGDLVFHYADGSLRALSRAKNDGYKSENTLANNEWSPQGWRVDMDYVELARALPIGELGPRLAQLSLEKGPINRSGGVNQGYLFRLTPEAAGRILGVLGDDPALPGVGLSRKEYESLRAVTEAFLGDVGGAGLQVDEALVPRLLAALLAKRFLLLTGLSGSGKTKLAQALAVWMGGCAPGGAGSVTSAVDDRYAVVAVGANWTSKEDLLGYPDALSAGVFRAKPALELLLRAGQDPTHPYFLILDEMNLSHVERYFADFLSAMESGEAIWLHDGGDWQTERETPVPASVPVPVNLFVIGTVNVDETTYMFSPKVLDRANVIEFRAEADAITGFLQNPQDVALETIAGQGSAFAAGFVAAAQRPTRLDEPAAGWLRTELEVLFLVLADHEAEFGFRTARDVARFLNFHLEISQGENCVAPGPSGSVGLPTPDAEWFRQAIDAVVMQKILPKMHGSKKKLGPVLRGLGEVCYGGPAATRLDRARKAAAGSPAEGSPLKRKLDDLLGDCRAKAARDGMRYPLSFEKIVRMLRKLDRDGFASFAEA